MYNTDPSQIHALITMLYTCTSTIPPNISTTKVKSSLWVYMTCLRNPPSVQTRPPQRGVYNLLRTTLPSRHIWRPNCFNIHLYKSVSWTVYNGQWRSWSEVNNGSGTNRFHVLKMDAFKVKQDEVRISNWSVNSTCCKSLTLDGHNYQAGSFWWQEWNYW